MSRSHNPKVVTNGLSFAIDAANTKSYNGTTIVTDLSLNSNTATLYNGVGYDSGNLGYFTFDGSNQYMEIPYDESVNITSGDFTVEFWMNSSTNQTSDVLVSYGDTSTVSGWAIKTASSPNRLQYSVGSAIHPAVAGIVTDGLVLNLDAGDTNSYPGSGTIWYNLTGNGNNGTLVNGVGYNSDNGGSLVFDGTDDYVNAPITKTASCTFSCWAKTTTFGSNPMLFNAGPSGTGPDLFFYNSKISWNTWDGDSNSFASIPASATDGNWHYYVVVNDASSNAKLYYDGELLGTATYKNASTNINLTIGGNTNTFMWNGSISNFILHNKALTPTEIQRNYNALKGRFTSQPSALDPIDLFNSIESADFSSGITTNTWNHYALVRSGNVYTPYVNAIAGSPSYDYSNINLDLYFDNASIILNANGDNGSTDIIDSSKNNHTGIITAYNGAAISTAESKFGGSSLYFDGTNDYIDCGISDDYSFGTGDFTIEFWHYIVGTDDWVSTNMIFSTMNTSPVVPGFALSLTGNQFYFWFYTSSGSISGNVGIFPPRDTWYHVVWERKNGAILFFINGEKQLEGTQPHTQVDYTNNTLVLGRDLTFSSYAKESYIDDFRVTKGVAKYTTDFTPPNQASYYSNDPNYDNLSILLQGNGQNLSTNIIDSSPNNHTGIITAYNGASISTAESKFGGSSLYFDGTNTYIDCGTDPSYAMEDEDFTIEFWIYVDQPQTSSYVFMIGPQSDLGDNTVPDGGLSLDISASESSAALTFVTKRSSGSQGVGFNITPGQWNHIAIIRSGSSGYIFVNGTDRRSFSISSNPYNESDITLGSRYYISSGTRYYGRYFNGYIDDFRVTKGVAKYTTDFTPPDRTKIQNNEASLKFGASGIGNTNPFNGSLSNLKIYKNSLTSTEIEDNFNALKGRYGL